MKTVSASLRAVDDNLRFAADAAVRPLGPVHADALVRYVFGLPHDVPAEVAADPDRAPGLFLEGRHGQWLRLVRREKGSDLRLSVKDGETDLLLPEIQAVYRVRSFVEHWGEDTELTAEIRLPPEAREMIADRERTEDETRRRRMAEAAPRDVFVKRPWLRPAVAVLVGAFLYGLAYAAALLFLPDFSPTAQMAGAAVLLFGLLLSPWLFFRKYEIVVDREHGEVREHLIGKERPLARLADLRHADVVGLDGRRPERECRVLLVRNDDGEIEVGHGGWSGRHATQIAESINDSIDLPAARRKVLAYRRHAGSGEGDA